MTTVNLWICAFTKLKCQQYTLVNGQSGAHVILSRRLWKYVLLSPSPSPSSLLSFSFPLLVCSLRFISFVHFYYLLLIFNAMPYNKWQTKPLKNTTSPKYKKQLYANVNLSGTWIVFDWAHEEVFATPTDKLIDTHFKIWCLKL